MAGRPPCDLFGHQDAGVNGRGECKGCVHEQFRRHRRRSANSLKLVQMLGFPLEVIPVEKAS